MIIIILDFQNSNLVINYEFKTMEKKKKLSIDKKK